MARDRTSAAPRIGLAWATLLALPPHSRGPRGDAPALAAAVRDAGFGFVQCHDQAPVAAAQAAGLDTTGLARCLDAAAVDAAAARACEAGHQALTLHLGHGLESEAEADALLDAVARAERAHGLPLWVETHRATLTQDPWRTLQLLRRHPGLRLAGDFSHWVAGCELRYGPLEDTLAGLAPVFAHTALVQLRVASSGSFQRHQADDGYADDLALMQRLWRPCLAAAAARGEPLRLCVELLPAALGYAATRRDAGGRRVEDGDRWLEALRLQAVARELVAELPGATTTETHDTAGGPTMRALAA